MKANVKWLEYETYLQSQEQKYGGWDFDQNDLVEVHNMGNGETFVVQHNDTTNIGRYIPSRFIVPVTNVGKVVFFLKRIWNSRIEIGIRA